MQSSPPTRAWERPSSPATSQYSIDLAALDLDSRSGTSTPLPQQHIDQVLSEDIDGPSDFTQNMEAWMRGGTLKKNSLKSGLQSLKERREQSDDGRTAQDGGNLLTPGLPEGEPTESHHTPSNSPPRESVFDDHRENQDAEGDSSEWNLYAEADTPYPPPHKHFLQPTVEDYYSELTPARPQSNRVPQSMRRSSSVPETEKHSPSKSEPSTPGRPSSDTISPVRSPVFQCSVPRQFSSQSHEASFEKQMQEIREKCEHLERLNTTLGQALDEERRLRKEESAAHEAQLADGARQEHDLAEMKDQAHAHKEDFRREFSEMRQRLQSYEQEQDDDRKESERLKREYAAEVRKLKEDLERVKAEHNQEARAVRQDLDLARRSRDDAEDNARVIREELDEYRDGHAADLDPMQLKLHEYEDLRNQVSELKFHLESVESENEILKAAKKAADDKVTGIRTEILLLRQSQEEETRRLTSDHRRAVDLAEDMQAQLKEVRQQLRDREVETKRTPSGQDGAQDVEEVHGIREELEAKQTALNESILERDAVRDDLEAQQSALNSATLDRDALQDTLQSTQADLEATKLQLADLEAVNAALDARVSDAIRRREVYWRGRLEEVEKERRVMVKALMRQWGREEVGVEEPQQGYAYMFAPSKTAA